LGGPGPSGVPSPAVTPGTVPPGVSLSAATSAVLVTIDPATGVRTPVGPLGFNSLGFIFGEGLAFDAAGNLWFYGSSDDPACTAAIDLCLFKLDPDTGAATFVARGSLTTGPLLTLVVGATATCSAVLGTTLDFEDEEDAVSASLATVNTTNAS